MNRFVSQRAKYLKRSAIRELLKLTEEPGIISFAGGLPDPETFPNEKLADIAFRLLREKSSRVLQYGTTEGSNTLRNACVLWLASQGIHITRDQILITASSQQGLDLLSKAFLDPDDVVFVDLPTYIGALQAFGLFQAHIVGIPMEKDGMNLTILESRIVEAKRSGKRTKGIYVVPDFQNPSGITMSLEKRTQLLEIARTHDLLVFEDNPYGELRFTGESIPSIRSFDVDGRVIMLLSFSKILAAGLRLGILIADGELMETLVRVKQPTDLCTSRYIQHLAAGYLNSGEMDGHLSLIRRCYGEKCEAMVAALKAHMPKSRDIKWTEPEGGLFLFLTLPERIDAEAMLERAVARKVAYVPGYFFYPDGSGRNTARLSFSVNTLEEIHEGIGRLAEVVEAEIANQKL
ncbi:MAG: PLP-dependent aminotransferase family protein [Candidatus Paceibacterota bacterium]|jgi:2-aminoadipate transaminase